MRLSWITWAGQVQLQRSLEEESKRAKVRGNKCDDESRDGCDTRKGL